jgi:hypothetical protein
MLGFKLPHGYLSVAPYKHQICAEVCRQHNSTGVVPLHFRVGFINQGSSTPQYYINCYGILRCMGNTRTIMWHFKIACSKHDSRLSKAACFTSLDFRTHSIPLFKAMGPLVLPQAHRESVFHWMHSTWTQLSHVGA